jgi:Uma2 family endonuclease
MVAGHKLGPQTCLQPDVSISHENQGRAKYLEGAPAVAIEVISPSNSAEQVDRKIKKYLDNGALEAWVFYPKTRRVYVHRKGHLQEFRDELRSDIIPGLKIDLESVFG